MLGAGPSHYPATDLHLPPGSLLALYTDGLIEQPRQDITTGMTRLARALTATPPRPPHESLDDLCDSVLATLGENAQDDIALLLARTTTHHPHLSPNRPAPSPPPAPTHPPAASSRRTTRQPTGRPNPRYFEDLAEYPDHMPLPEDLALVPFLPR